MANALSPALDALKTLKGNEVKGYFDILKDPTVKANFESDARKDAAGNPIVPTVVGSAPDGSDDWKTLRQHAALKESDPGWVDFTVSPSSAGSILGVNPHMTAQELFAEKTGMIPALGKAEKPEEIFKAGHEAEPYIADHLQKKLEERFGEGKVTVYYEPATYAHGLWRNLLGNPDRLVVADGHLYGGEIKSCHSQQVWNKWWDKGLCPPYYEVQCRMYMAIFNLPRWYIISQLGWLEERVICIERDLALEDYLLSRSYEFVEMCRNGQMPLPGAEEEYAEEISAYLLRLYGVQAQEKGGSFLLTDEGDGTIASAFEQIRKYAEEKAEIEKKLAELENRYSSAIAILVAKNKGAGPICLAYHDDEKAETTYVNLNVGMHRAGFDEENFKAEHPQLYKDCCKEVFDAALLAKKAPEMKERYKTPATPNPDKPVTIKKVSVFPDKKVQ